MNDKYQPCPCGSGRKFKFCCYETIASPGSVSNYEFPVHRCFANLNWQEQGLAQVVVVREMPNLTYRMGVYLADVFCLGVKDTFVHSGVNYEELKAFLRRSPMPFHEIAYEDARSIVLGAVEYARQLGFEPPRDWASSKSILESERSFDNKFKFGKDGKPFYIQGPADNPKKIMAKLEPLVKQGKADFLTVVDLG